MTDYLRETRETEALQRDLEWATASTAPPDRGVDPQTAALREAWTAWGRLLESAEAPIEASMIYRSEPRSPRRRRLRAGVAMGTALLVLIAGTVWFALAARRSDAPLPEGDVAERVAQPSRLHGSAAETPAPEAVADSKNSLPQTASAGPATAWEDTVDDEIVEVSEKFIAVQQDWQTRADALDVVWCGLSQIQAEVETEQL